MPSPLSRASRSRAGGRSCCSAAADGDSGILLASVHLEPAASLAEKWWILERIAEVSRGPPRCVAVLAGEYNFTHTADPRANLRRLDVVMANEPTGTAFKRTLPDFVEMEHPGHTRRQMEGGIVTMLSRLDRVYLRSEPSDLDGLCTRAQVLGDVQRRDSPSDQVPVSVHMSRPRHPLMQSDLLAALCRSDAFRGALLPQVPAEGPVFERLGLLEDALRVAVANAARVLDAERQLPASVAARAALVALRASRRHDARAVCRAVGELSSPR